MTDNAESTKQPNKCPVCGHLNRPGAMVCDNCGTLLDLRAETGRATRDLRDNDNNDPNTEVSTEAQTAIAKADQIKVRGAEYQQGLTVHLHVDTANQPMAISPDMLKGDVVIGRRDPITEQAPEIDLDQFAGYRMGVSRRHAIMRLMNGSLTLLDLGSANGTYLNGKRLKPREPEVLLENDIMRLGQIVMTVKFVVVGKTR
jgi:hypothetical protein